MDFNFDEIIDETPVEGKISFIASIDNPVKGDIEQEVSPENIIPVLPLRGVMLFPETMLPISIGRDSSLKLLKEAQKKDMAIAVFTQVDDSTDEPDYEQLYHTGVIGKVQKIIKLPDGSRTALIQGYSRVRLIELSWNGSYNIGRVDNYPETVPERGDREYMAVVDACRETAIKLMRASENMIGSAFALNNISDRTLIINFICCNLNISNRERIVLLEENNLFDRAYRLLGILQREYQYVTLKMDLQMRTREELDKQHKEYFLRQEMETIQEQLGEKGEDEIMKMREKAQKMKWDEATAKVFNDALDKMSHMSSHSPDYQTEYTWAQMMLELPWGEYTKDNLNLNNAERVLNKDHYGMEKVKERIIEHLAVLKMRGDFKSPILCLYGPPGVGKTSLGKSIAKAMKRKYVRMSLGGLHDEAEIRGHRRTYVGAMAGQIIKNIKKAGSSNPVFILDEIDKVTQQTNHGDPASALLEVLDPEQNVAFHDNYLDTDYDLSKVMFIATANNISTIPAPLLDRMELIEVSGYLTEEKIEIAKRHLVPKELDNLGMKDTGVKLSKAAIEKIIEDYTRESGVRDLDKNINKVLRKVTLKYAKNGVLPESELKVEDIKEYLGTEPYSRDKYQGNDYYGVVTGLAWTSVGGEILFIETSIDSGKGGKLGLTGNLGDVMKESATIALQYLKEHCDLIGIQPDYFENHNIHIHVPEGATPKDGPSAGITIATSLASAITKRKVRKNIAMTGEITLRGKVLPVGGIKEKILAAKRAGITDILICHENRKNIEDIPAKYVKGVKFHYVENVKDVLDFALLK
ncbi:MAG: endopeptidase La [Prevotellaceae bacterium]|nr:endopeptidase La [Bacteroidaceae bacterium]MCI6803008.1 endopeptidase La [Prevotellaceae bacterium]MDD6015839.1 endopeptidase La [Prevotellaceae bacterium]MDY6257805.1 endopeptidase La [Bacteroidaceae bacterium]